MSPTWAVAVAVGLLASGVFGDDLAVLKRLAEAEADAPDEWTALSKERQVALLRSGLRSEDDEIAFLAARVVDPECLSLDEVRLQAKILSSRVEWIRDPEAAAPPWLKGQRRWPIGAPDLPRIWQTACSVKDLPEAAQQLVYYHRALLPEHIPVLVEHLDDAGPAVFLALAENLRLVADYTDEHRAAAARGFLYVLERLRCERRGKPPPTFENLDVDPGSKAAFIRLASASWGLELDGFRVEDGPSLYPPRGWLIRWARAVRMSKEDVPFLDDVVWLADDSVAKEAVRWAIRQLAELDAREELLDIAVGGDSLAVLARGELARRGDRSRFLEIVGDRWEFELEATMAWYATPVEARRRRLGKLLLSPGVGDLVPLTRYDIEAEFGVRIRDQDLAWIGENLLKIDVQPERLAAYFGCAYPEGLTIEIAREIARRLRSPEVSAWLGRLEAVAVDFDEPQPGSFLAHLETLDRTAAVEVLDQWATAGCGGLVWLARLGEARQIPAMLAEWEHWSYEGWILGRVHDPRVEQFLRERAKSGDGDAVMALAIFYGLPEPLRYVLEDADDAATEFVLERDPIGAVLHSLTADPARARAQSIARLGHANDDRALAFLRRLRIERHHGQYWAATAGLALAGDESARREFGTLMREGRTWMLDALDDGMVRTMGGEKEWVDFWVTRVNTNCCLSYIAISVLREIYPTIPIAHDKIIDFGRKDLFARRWIDQRTFRYSRLLDGLVPTAKRG